MYPNFFLGCTYCLPTWFYMSLQCIPNTCTMYPQCIPHLNAHSIALSPSTKQRSLASMSPRVQRTALDIFQEPVAPVAQAVERNHPSRTQCLPNVFTMCPQCIPPTKAMYPFPLGCILSGRLIQSASDNYSISTHYIVVLLVTAHNCWGNAPYCRSRSNTPHNCSSSNTQNCYSNSNPI